MGADRSCVTVIIADDHKPVHVLLRRLLRETEFEIIESVFGGQALVEAAARLKPHLIIVDVCMPVLDGIEAVQQVKVHSPEISVVFISVDHENDTVERALRTGALGFVRKGSAAEDLLLAARTVLRGQLFVSSGSR